MPCSSISNIACSGLGRKTEARLDYVISYNLFKVVSFSSTTGDKRIIAKNPLSTYQIGRNSLIIDPWLYKATHAFH